MLRLEAIPYKGLDQHLELGRELEQKKRNEEFRDFHDLGNCFIIEHFGIERGIDVMDKAKVSSNSNQRTHKSNKDFVYLL
ncbi:hypothetical protein [Clostridium magnum]|uniref:hypothetical protein n=1 Tax=Clostridium magnum TaxID=33954 RepID=UPI00092394C7|nr:hypothetical protein [Clostridium magnum]SHJ14434.1 hypothetical protein SAMN02745944_05440 [Clostridium magnum DSM 2767]